ncbi:hypothetical protein DRN69_02720 [Candidatus Pacearchaeota archaeon]|mgnify:CR=1 FL=1|nr:MAG: hypothetical protein DRN69_02720 [Candidatus Pacearchaeota archaeon]
MTRFEFWKEWKKKTRLEKEAIRSIKTAKKIILSEIPREQIVSIYVKGSFIRREMNKKSDVDILIILRRSRFLNKLKRLEEEYREKCKPSIQFAGYSIWELKRNMATNNGKAFRLNPSRTVQHLECYKLLYGKKLRKKDFCSGHPKVHFEGMIYAFKKIFIPKYKRREFGFSEVIKQVFWLTENEQLWKGKNPPYHWRKLAKSIKDKNHIIYDALRFRVNPTKDKKKRANFIKKLEKHLANLEDLLK